MRISNPILSAGIGVLVFALAPAHALAQAAAAPKTTTRDIPFTSHDGYPMVGRLTLPDTPGLHPVLMLVQTAEAQTMDGELRNAQGVRVRVFNQYREQLAPLGIGFFSYEGRGVTSNAGGGPVIDRAVYDTSTLANKVQDGISAVRTLQQQPDVDRSQIVLRGISEGTLLAAEIAVQIPSEIGGLVLSGVIGSNLKEALVFMASDGAYLAHLANWDVNGDGRISAAEFEADTKGIRRQLPQGTSFGVFDRNGDGVYTRDELLASTRPIVEAIETENFGGFIPWLTASAATQVPRTMTEWARDNFSQPTMWDLLSKLSMPVGLFQGEADHNTPAEGVRALEQKAGAAGKTNLEFRYFAGLDHGLGTIEYFNTGTPSTGYAAIFEFMTRYRQP
jgi:pimeloyl-ACP methyl ester carboxylesterase